MSFFLAYGTPGKEQSAELNRGRKLTVDRSVPPNCRFEIDDVEDDWMFSAKFDYIHGRHMVGSITDFPKLFNTIYENLNPGGWVEMQDYYVKLQSSKQILGSFSSCLSYFESTRALFLARALPEVLHTSMKERKRKKRNTHTHTHTYI